MAHLHWKGKKSVENHYSKIPFHTLDLLYTYPSTTAYQGSSITHKEPQEICYENLAENKIIKGDNLLALKSLLPMYASKIQCIYIDPPYNTGAENWVYNDNVNSPLMQKWLSKAVNRDDLTRHDKWLCMMYPRLRLLHELLSESGVIFISIDDNEMARLKLLCDEIFGERNFVANLIWQKKKGGGGSDSKYFQKEHEYIICYKKQQWEINDLIEKYDEKQFNKIINGKKAKIRKLEKDGNNSLKIDRPSLYYAIKDPNGNDFYPLAPNGEEGRWRKKPENLNFNQIFWQKNSKGRLTPYEVTYFDEVQNKDKILKTKTIFAEHGTTTEATKEIQTIFNNKVFDTPKPTELIKHILQIATKKDSIILDSFAGSGTTAHAVLELNKQDNGNRKFILIECEDYADSITAQRVKHAISGYGKEPMLNATGGEFSFLEVGEPVLVTKNHQKVLNQGLKIQKILEYIFYTEFNTTLSYDKEAFSTDYFVGEVGQKALYFIYEKHRATTLNLEFLPRLKQQDSYIIYADNCTLSQEQLERLNIEFKLIPRDIRKL